MSGFASVPEAVDALARLLQARDWTGLAACYEADPAALPPAFFYDPEAPGHPGGFDRWRHPFPPGFTYRSHAVEGDVAVVRMGIEIDQGGGMIQRGSREFRMR
jgi:hypothetical protein